jgi:hypothetical protein
MRQHCFTLPEAVLTLYRPAAGQVDVPGEVVWSGVAEQFRNDQSQPLLRLWPMGAGVPRVHAEGALEHHLSLARVWALDVAASGALTDEFMGGESYLMDVLWCSGNWWHRRRYTGVTLDLQKLEDEVNGRPMLHQDYSATGMTQAHGVGAQAGLTPLPITATLASTGRVTPETLGLQGRYVWSGPMRLTRMSARVSGTECPNAVAQTATEFRLKVNGTLTSTYLAPYMPNVDFPPYDPFQLTVGVDLNLALAAGDTVEIACPNSPSDVRAQVLAEVSLTLLPA